MSTPEAAAPEEGAAKKKKKKGKLLLLVGAPIMLGGVFAGGLFAAKAGLVPGMKPDAAKSAGPELQYEETDSGKRLKTTYLPIEGAFTTNLADSQRLVQAEVGVASNYDPKLLDGVKTHELPIRAAVLGVLAQQEEDAFATPAARSRVQRELKVAINRVLAEKAGHGIVSDVYFSSLVVQ